MLRDLFFSDGVSRAAHSCWPQFVNLRELQLAYAWLIENDLRGKGREKSARVSKGGGMFSLN